jgi:hypothetical protein
MSDVEVLTLAPMFAPGEALVTRVVDRLAHFASIRTLRKTQVLIPEQASRALDVAFWASLGTSEGRPTHTRVLFAEPELLPAPLKFDAPIPYEPARVTRLSPAVPEGGCIGVSPSGMTIWGVHAVDPGSSLNALSIVIPMPGVLHVRIGPLRPYAVVSNGTAAVLADAAFMLPERLRELLGKSLTDGDIRQTQRAWRECLMLAALARRVLHRGSGGTLLVVPSRHGNWRGVLEFAHKFAKPDCALHDAVLSELGGEDVRGVAPDLPEALKWQVIGAIPGHLSAEAAALRRVAPYANVDGAVVLTRELEVLGFGAKIVASNGTSHVLVDDDKTPIEDIGGTRHQSAARFVGASRDCVAIVVSHDGHISLLHYDDAAGCVRMMPNVEWWD